MNEWIGDVCDWCIGTGQNTGKTVAIILGGAAGVGFLVILLMFARGAMKKHDGMHFLEILQNLICFSLLIFYTLDCSAISQFELGTTEY